MKIFIRFWLKQPSFEEAIDVLDAFRVNIMNPKLNHHKNANKCCTSKQTNNENKRDQSQLDVFIIIAFRNITAPPASGNPFDSVAPLPRQYAPQRISAPHQSPLAHRHQSATQQTRYYQPQPQPSYRAPSAANAYSQTRSHPQTRQAGTPLVTKHFYIHAAPEEPEEHHPPRYVQIGQPRKNYKSYY